jgi:Na+-transporting NADH:ubiquinone oxidoreductase subunit A
MSKIIKLKKGLDLKVKGNASAEVVEVLSGTYAIKPTDFIGFKKPKVLVKPGDKVKAGTQLYFDKDLPEVKYTSPVSGEVIEIKRGAQRRLLEIVVKADNENSYEEFRKHSISDLGSLSMEDARNQILDSGIWSSIIQRPFAVVAKPKDVPRSIFISCFDSAPLAQDFSFTLKGEDKYFAAGVDVLKKFCSDVQLSINADSEPSSVFSAAKDVQVNKISGKHPAGNVGIQINNIAPINKGDLVWTMNPFAVVQIGKLFLEGIYDASKIIAFVGPEVTSPKYVKTKVGANVAQILEGNLNSEHVRVVSGNVLVGEKIEKDGFIGYYANALTVLAEGDDYKLFGSFDFTSKRYSFSRAFGLLSFLGGGAKEYDFDTNTNGEHRPFVQTGEMEKVLPMDILPIYLLKAILAQDFDEMEALGIYEVAEEDFALCEVIDSSKTEVQSIIRKGIDLMLYS